MNDEKLKRLKDVNPPASSAAAKARALSAALEAFDAEQKNPQTAPQGYPWRSRLRSMFDTFGRTWTMQTRLTYGLGTAAIALLLLPFGYQLYSSTAMSPLRDAAPALMADAAPKDAPKTVTMMANGGSSADAKTEDLALMAPATPAEDAPASTAAPQISAAKRVDPGMMAESAPASAPADMEAGAVLDEMAPAPEVGMAAPSMARALAPVESGDQFTRFVENPVKITANEPVSTFSIDVDTASYSYVRQALSEGFVPPPDAVRIEELVNYFAYDYPVPTDSAAPFKPTVMVYPTPWNAKTELVQIGIKGYVPPVTEHKPSNLVFLIDTSGSMDEPNKLPLLKRAFALLVNQLGESDTISIVAYAGSAGVVLEPTKASEKGKILAALDALSAGGSTAGAEGIELAYKLAEAHKVADGTNRVILATDGDFNVGIDDPDELKSFIAKKRDSGVFLSVLGFGEGNYGDDTAQVLAQNGNGNASYIDSFKEAQKVLVEDAGGTLETIAKDVKIQVEFNPALVSEYRLIGYETRALNREDFNNDKVDAGEIGAGTSVTALYEITPVGSGAELNDPLRYGDKPAAPVASDGKPGELGYLKLRYKLPKSDSSTLVETPIRADLASKSLAEAPTDARFAAAVAAFGQKLKGSNYGDMSWDDIRALAQGARGSDDNGYRAEFVQLIDLAKAVDVPKVVDVAPPCGNTDTSACTQ